MKKSSETADAPSAAEPQPNRRALPGTEALPPNPRGFSGMAPVSDGFLQAVPIEAKVWLPGETESGSAGTQPDEG